MSLELATCNIRESLAEPENMPDAVEQIKGLDSDVIILGDAYSITNTLHGSTEDTLHEAREKLYLAGYENGLEVEYDDESPWHHDRNIMMLSRIALDLSQIRLGTRNAIEGQAANQSGNILQIVGAHFDDRSEAAHIRQAKAFIQRYDPELPVVLAGDLNILDRGDKWSSVFGSKAFRLSAKYLPTARSRSIAIRIGEAARGTAMELLTNNGFVDTDSARQPTFSARRPFLRPDHILASPAVNIKTSVIEPYSKHIDHLALKANVSW
jgi:endonuclease/exonuclease/phosphatase family metal-dependent hydrolase